MLPDCVQTSTPNVTEKELPRRVANIPAIAAELTANESLEDSFKALSLSGIDRDDSRVLYSLNNASKDMFETLDRSSLEMFSCQSTSLHKSPVQSSVGASEYEADQETKSDHTDRKDSDDLSLCLLTDISEVSEDEPSPVKSMLQELRDSCSSAMVTLRPVRYRSSGRVVPARDKVLLLCDQDDAIPFRKYLYPAMMKKCRKIGEGVFAEVYKTRRGKDDVALKVLSLVL